MTTTTHSTCCACGGDTVAAGDLLCYACDTLPVEPVADALDVALGHLGALKHECRPDAPGGYEHVLEAIDAVHRAIAAYAAMREGNSENNRRKK